MRFTHGRSMGPFESIDPPPPRAIEEFLSVSGWKREEIRPGISSIWSLSRADASIMLPQNKEYRDYSTRLNEALRVVAEVHNINSSESLSLAINGARSDILLLRADQSTRDGSIPLIEAQDLISGAVQMLTAAACSAVKPSYTIPKRRPDAARNFLADKLFMGHTMRGSFILTIFARHADSQVDDPSTLAEDGIVQGSGTARGRQQVTSFSRQVMAMLSTGLEATSKLLDDEPSISLDEAVEQGASAELIDSIGTMSSHIGLKALDMGFRWSPSQPNPPSNVATRVVIQKPSPESIRRLTESLRKKPTARHKEVIGQVVRLERDQGDSSGIAIIDGNVGRDRRRIWIELSGDMYRLAIRAHDGRRRVVADGRIVFKKGSWWMDDVRSFALAEA